MKAIALAVLVSLIQVLFAADCVFQSGNITNCLNYCMTYFSDAPQRMYYNQTSRMCQPMVQCQTPIVHVYNYDKNQCFTDATLSKVAPSLIPATLTTTVSLQNYDTFICVNGYQVSVLTQSFCTCKLLWEDSTKYDINGNKYKCDQVVKNIQGYFLHNLVYDDNGNILFYGQFSPSQLKAILTSLQSQQASQTSQFALTQASSILNLIDQTLSTEPIIRTYQIPYVVLISCVILIIFGTSYFKFQSEIIKVNKQQFIAKIMQVTQEQTAFIRKN